LDGVAQLTTITVKAQTTTARFNMVDQDTCLAAPTPARMILAGGRCQGGARIDVEWS
jgi:hypothetical protein